MNCVELVLVWEYQGREDFGLCLFNVGLGVLCRKGCCELCCINVFVRIFCRNGNCEYYVREVIVNWVKLVYLKLY